MNTIREWLLLQVAPKSVVSSRSVSGSSDGFFHEEPQDEEFVDRGNGLVAPSVHGDMSTSESNQENQHNSTSLAQPEDSYHPQSIEIRTKSNQLTKIENLQIKFLRILRRIGNSQGSPVVAKVLYRLHLATLIRASESDLKQTNLTSDSARSAAAEQEVTGIPELDFSFRVLVLGKTGVGKSATINSIFDQTMSETDASRPATGKIREISGTIHGIKVTFVDTPGLLPSSVSNLRRNRKILCGVKRFIRRSPPDIVLYFERLDLINMDYSDSPLLKLVTEVFGSSIWFNTMLVMTHSSLDLPEPPIGHESHVTQCTDLIQNYIHEAVSDTRLDNPVILVENHPDCKRNFMGEKVWKSQFLLFCVCSKVLGDANTILGFRDGVELGKSSGTRLPSLPHLLSSLLRHRGSSLGLNGARNEDYEILLDAGEEDEYDQLPPIRILTKSQFERLSNSQKKDYLDELDYRETLYLKKQLKEETQKRKENEDSGEVDPDSDPEPVLLPDMAVPFSFDSDHPVHRYRCLVSSDQWLVRPVLDSQGWDHDVGFEGINVETGLEIKRNFFASVSGQMSKDKQDFNIQSESAVGYVGPTGPTCSVGFDVQSSGKDLICTTRGDAKSKNVGSNVTGCGVSVTSFGRKFYIGSKIEDSILIRNRVKLMVNAGRMEGNGQVAYGGTVEGTLRGRDYPVRDDKVSLTMTVLSLDKDMVLGGSVQSDFRASRGTRVSVNASLNTRRIGQICIKTSSSEHMEIALIAIFSILRGILKRKKANELRLEEEPEEDR